MIAGLQARWPLACVALTLANTYMGAEGAAIASGLVSGESAGEYCSGRVQR